MHISEARKRISYQCHIRRCKCSLCKCEYECFRCGGGISSLFLFISLSMAAMLYIIISRIDLGAHFMY